MVADATFITVLDPDQDPQARPDGVRLAVKDVIDVAGVPTTAGSRAVAETARPAERDAACLAGARAAGARIVGKANLHELCFGATGVNAWSGTPSNPLDPARVPGGSSSGSAVAVATGAADVAYGTDTTGSLRNPAACCGVVGLRPTWGRIPLDGIWPLAPTLDTVGPLGRTVADVVAGLALLEPGFDLADAAPAPSIGRFRVPHTAPVVDAAVDRALAAAGLPVTEIELPGWDAAHDAGATVLFGEALASNRALWPDRRHLLGEDLVERFTSAEAIGPGELGAARARREPWYAELAEVLGTVGVIALPTMLDLPARIGDHAVAPNAAAVAPSLAGIPAIALPVPTGGHLPASIQLLAPAHHEALLLATAAAIESAAAGHP